MAARKDLSSDERQEIAVQMLAADRPRGLPQVLATEYGISRQMTYYLRHQAAQALRVAFAFRSGPAPIPTMLKVTPTRLRRAVTLLSLVGVSERDTQLVLAELLDTPRSLGYVAQVLQQAQALATERNAALQPAVAGLQAADEIFCQGHPILGIVQPSSLYLSALTLADHRDASTWGCLLLEQPTTSAGLISDAGTGLAAGATAADIACHTGDWFHPLLLAGYVEAQYERRAYTALGRVYAREDKLRAASTAKRWEHHWAHYLREVAAADTAIARYDAWRLLRWQLRELSGQFDWETGAVRDPAQVQAALHALATAFAPWAAGVKATALVDLLCHQASALTRALPQVAAALTAVQAAWGSTATQVVQRLGQALHEYACPGWPPAHRQRLTQAITESLAWASAHLGRWLPTLQHLVAGILAHWPRTSCAIECLNSLLRPYLNGRKHVSQGFLELFRYYHNTHPFTRGKRAGHSPLELAGGPTIADPLAYLGLGAKA